MMGDPGGPGPPDTGQFIDYGQITETSSMARGSMVISNNPSDYMDTGNNSVNFSNKRNHSDTDIDSGRAAKQSAVQVSQAVSESEHAHVIHKNNNKYRITDAGPYFVIVENKNNMKLHRMSIGKILFKSNSIFKDKITEISQLGKSKVKVELNNAISANNLTTSDLLNNEELETYIPDFNLYKFGLVRGIDIEISPQEIIEEARSEYKIISARRETRRRKTNDSFEIISLASCILKFDGQKLPNHIFLYGIRCEVSPYIPPVIQCFNCLRYGHMSKSCKSKTRCSRCQGPHPSKDCEAAMVCLYCKSDHSALYRKCPEFFKQKQIKKLMTLNNLTHLQAKKMVTSSYATITSENLPNLKSFSDFPSMERSRVVSNNIPSTSHASTSFAQIDPISTNFPVRKHFNITRSVPYNENKKNF